ncbi:MAG: CcmD family protein [Bacteroidota bacterium]
MPRYLTLFRALLLLFLSLVVQTAVAEVPSSSIEMADVMRSNGKIYVVLAVVLILQIGLFAFLWTLDRRLSRWEATNASKN